jgi:hypothetical protein
MISKNLSIVISGKEFYPSTIVKKYNLNFDKYHDVGDVISIKSKRQFDFGRARIYPPETISFNEQIDNTDNRIYWLLNYYESIDLFIPSNTEIILDIDYSLDLSNLSQSYIDFITIDQIKKMSEFGIGLNFTFWPNKS